jgi:hypothetical protein
MCDLYILDRYEFFNTNFQSKIQFGSRVHMLPPSYVIHKMYNFRPELHEISTTKMVDDFLEEFTTHRGIFLLFFGWLIFMYTPCDPWDVQLLNLKTM